MYSADVISYSDYYPFGMLMPNRYTGASEYRYGFNGEEMDDEVRGTKGASYDLGARMYDPRIGRMLSIDPWTKKYPWQTPYAYHKNSPISIIDWKGYGDPKDRKANKGIKDHEKSNKAKAGTAHKEGIYADVSMTKGNTNNPDKAFPSKIAADNNLTTQQLYALNPGLEKNRHSIGQGQFIRTVPEKGKKLNDYTYTATESIGAIQADVTATAGAVGGSGSSMKYYPTKFSLSWEGGGVVQVNSLGAAQGLVGFNGSLSAGTMNITLGPENNYSMTNALNKESLTVATDVISPIWVGGTYTHISSSDYSVNLYGVAFGTPGVGVSTVSSKYGASSVFVVRDALITTQDSVNRALEILYYHPESTYHRDFVNNRAFSKKLKPLH